MDVLREHWQLLIPLLLLQVALFAAGLVDLLRRRPEQVTGGAKWPWVIALFLNIIGPLAYFAFGRKD